MTKESAYIISRLCAAIVTVISGVCVGYWLWISRGGENFFPSLTVIKFNTALCMVLSGIALSMLCGLLPPFLKYGRYPVAMIVMSIGGWTLLEYLGVAPFNVDQWLFLDTTGGIQNYPGRMSPNTAVSFIIIGYLFLVINVQKPCRVCGSQILTWVVMTIAGFSIVGYMFGTEALYGISQATRMSPWTSGCFIFLSLGILMLFPEQGLLARFSEENMSGRMLRNLLPAAVLIPIVLEWFQIVGANAGLYEREFGEVLIALMTSIIMIALVIWNANVIRKLETTAKNAAAEVQLSEARIKAILDNTPAVVFMKDQSGRYFLVNHQFEDLFHIRNADAVGKTDYEIFPKEHADQFVAVDRQVLNEGRAIQTEEVAPHDDGPHNYITTKFPVWDPILQQQVLCGIATDVTAKKQAEAKLMEVAKIKSDFASMVSHELRSPLALIKGAIEMVDDGVMGAVNNDQKKYLDIAARNLDRLERLITNVLDYQKIESGHVVYHKEPRVLHTTIADTLEGFKGVIANKGLRFEVNVPQNLPMVLCDKDALIQVVTNLLSNAIKFTDRGTIAVSAQQVGDFVKISVIDNGIGISKEDQSRLFQSFSRIDIDGRRAPGSGLGLVICRMIVEAHQGKMDVRSEPGKGSTFFFTLPVAREGITSAT